MRKNVFEFALDINLPSPVLIRRVVNGDTSNEFQIRVTNKGKAVNLDSTLDKVVAVFRRSDGQVYTQDSNSGLSFTNGSEVVTIDVRSSSFRTGVNTIELQIYSRENQSDTEYAGLITTQQAQFTARAATLVGDGETAPSQLPMLEQLIVDATAAAAAANAAAAACKLYVFDIDTPTWDGDEFETTALSPLNVIEAHDSGKILAFRLPNNDNSISLLLMETLRGTDEVCCGPTVLYDTTDYEGKAIIYFDRDNSTVQIGGIVEQRSDYNDMVIILDNITAQGDEAHATVFNQSTLTSIVNKLLDDKITSVDLWKMTCVFEEPFHGGSYAGSNSIARLRRYKITTANDYWFEFGDDKSQYETVEIFVRNGTTDVQINKGW